MAHVHLITGGQRSGKSRYAQQLAESQSNAPLYIATAHIWDDDFKKRVDRHKQDRGPQWTTVEEEIDIHALSLPSDEVVIIDCITLWLTNIFHECEYRIDPALEKAKKIWDSLQAKQNTFLVVTNELGMGIHAEHESARKFADLQGWMNQHIAASAHNVTLMVSGIPTKIK